MTISQYIEQDLESRIRSGIDLPTKLTVGAIAARYDVSATPVRLALQCLIEKQLVERQVNGRLRFADSQVNRKKVSRPSKPVDWEGVLANEILLMSLHGEDRFVREEFMAEKHGIGRSLLRRVFHRLAGGGLIEHVPRRGWRVRAFRKEDMDAFLDVRELLEVQALDLSRHNLIKDDLFRMLEGNSEAAVAQSHIDNNLHSYFVEKSENRYIASFFETHGGYYTALFDYATLGVAVVSEMAEQHREILDHILMSRWAKARMALAHHIRSQKPVMERFVGML